MRVREALAAELPSLAAAVSAQPLLTRYDVTAEKLARDLGGAIERGEGLLVVEDEDGAAGFAWYLSCGTFVSGGYLRLIALAPGREGQGLGAALLDEVEKRAAATTHNFFLLVSHWNEAAQRFYQRRGYERVGVLAKFVRADTDEIIYCKKIS